MLIVTRCSPIPHTSLYINSPQFIILSRRLFSQSPCLSPPPALEVVPYLPHLEQTLGDLVLDLFINVINLRSFGWTMQLQMQLHLLPRMAGDEQDATERRSERKGTMIAERMLEQIRLLPISERKRLMGLIIDRYDGE